MPRWLIVYKRTCRKLRNEGWRLWDEPLVNLLAQILCLIEPKHAEAPVVNGFGCPPALKARFLELWYSPVRLSAVRLVLRVRTEI